MIPYRSLCHRQVKLTIRSIICTAGNIAYRACPLRTLSHVDINNRSFIISYLHIAGNIQNSGGNAFTGIQVNSAPVSLQCIILAICSTVSHIHCFNSCTSSRYSSVGHNTESTACYIFNIKVSLNNNISRSCRTRICIGINACVFRSNLIAILHILNSQIFIKNNVTTSIYINTISSR